MFKAKEFLYLCTYTSIIYLINHLFVCIFKGNLLHRMYSFVNFFQFFNFQFSMLCPEFEIHPLPFPSQYHDTLYYLKKYKNLKSFSIYIHSLDLCVFTYTVNSHYKNYFLFFFIQHFTIITYVFSFIRREANTRVFILSTYSLAISYGKPFLVY